MLWISIDPAKGASGVAHWLNDTLLHTSVLKPRGGKGQFNFTTTTPSGEIIHSIAKTRADAWDNALAFQRYVIIEKGAGFRPNVINAQGWIRGYLARAAEIECAPTFEVNVSEWRRVIREGYDISWPKERARKKERAKSLVEDLYSIKTTDDEADAILLGLASRRMGLGI